MTECLPDMPRYIRQQGARWEGADHPDGPWRPIPAPQSGMPWDPGRRGRNPPPPAADRPDTRRLNYLMRKIDGFVYRSKNRHDYALELAQRNGREAPSSMDELNGFRQMIDDAMAKEVEP